MQNTIQPTRRRVVWSDVEVEILVASFKKNDKPTRSEVAVLLGILEYGRTEKQVRNWFMNQRSKANKMKRDKEAFLSPGNQGNISRPLTQVAPTHLRHVHSTPPTPSPLLIPPITSTNIVKNDLEWPVFQDIGNPYNDFNLLVYHLSQSSLQPMPYFHNVQLNGFGYN